MRTLHVYGMCPQLTAAAAAAVAATITSRLSFYVHYTEQLALAGTQSQLKTCIEVLLPACPC